MAKSRLLLPAGDKRMLHETGASNNNQSAKKKNTCLHLEHGILHGPLIKHREQLISWKVGCLSKGNTFGLFWITTRRRKPENSCTTSRYMVNKTTRALTNGGGSVLLLTTRQNQTNQEYEKTPSGCSRCRFNTPENTCNRVHTEPEPEP